MSKTTKILTALSVILMLTFGALESSAQPEKGAELELLKPFGQGLPLPWPFPWAKECPMNWDNLSGRYSLEDSEFSEEIDLKISIVRRHGYRWIQVARFDSTGAKISDGQIMVERNQRSIRVRLRALHERERFTWASIKLHYASDQHLCAEKMLVPILTLEAQENETMIQTEYRLVRMKELPH